LADGRNPPLSAAGTTPHRSALPALPEACVSAKRHPSRQTGRREDAVLPCRRRVIGRIGLIGGKDCHGSKGAAARSASVESTVRLRPASWRDRRWMLPGGFAAAGRRSCRRAESRALYTRFRSRDGGQGEGRGGGVTARRLRASGVSAVVSYRTSRSVWQGEGCARDRRREYGRGSRQTSSRMPLYRRDGVAEHRVPIRRSVVQTGTDGPGGAVRPARVKPHGTRSQHLVADLDASAPR